MSNTDRIILWVVIIVVALAGGVGWYKFYAGNKTEETPVATVTPTLTATPSVTPTVTPSPSVTPIVDEGVTWITPVKMKDLKLFTVGVGVYYQVATLTNGGEIIDGFNGELGYSLYRFRYQEGKYYFLTKQSANFEADTFVDKVQSDYKTVYNGITTPASVFGEDGINYSGGDYSYMDYKDAFSSSLKSPAEVTSTQYGKIYRTDTKMINPITTTATKTVYVDGIYVRRTYLKSADTTIPSYDVKIKILKDDGVADVTFANGKKNKDIYVDRFSASCGSAEGHTIIPKGSAMVSDLIENGTATNSDKIYTITKTTNSMLKLAYDEYKMNRETSTLLSYSQFISKKPLLIWQDDLGDYKIMMNEKYGVLAECGKPVIYLYPERSTEVTVRVGADMTNSEPNYDGLWKAWARPSGVLTVDGKNYPYLFWEGLGWGEYPEISEGMVVETKGVKQALIQQMKQLGLNGKERADFLDFWLLKMPKTRYVRLTWFDTEQMNRLAPLRVNPRPDTMIRVFLDFQGLDEYVEMTPQILMAPERKGFTVVEWGGLLIK